MDDDTPKIINCDSPTNEDQALVNLKILANLKAGQKLVVSENVFKVDPPVWGQGVYRWWGGEGRDLTIKHINTVIEDVFKIIDKVFALEMKSQQTPANNNYYYKVEEKLANYFKPENSNILQTFSNEMTNAIKGLDNLKATYKTDVTVQSKLNVVIEKMKVRVSQISRLLKIQPQRYPLPTPPPNKPTRR